MDVDGGEIWVLGEQDSDDVLELGFFGGELFRDDGLGGAIADEEHLKAAGACGGAGELERLSSEELVGREGGADVAFGVFDEQFGASEVADVGPSAWVVHAVGEVAEQCDIQSVAGHLAEAEGTSGNAHVGVDSGEDDVSDFFCFEEIPDFGA